MTRLATVTEIEAAANDASVLPEIAPGFDFVDMTAFYQRPGNFALIEGDAVALFAEIEPGVVEGHYLFPDSVRGKKAVDAARKIIDTVFTVYQPRAIHGATPRDNRAARVMNRVLGFKPLGRTKEDASGRECVCYELRREEWAVLSAESSAESAA